ncbi:MAG: dihydroneopterin aldolase [Granulosicoccaceae bacterium]
MDTVFVKDLRIDTIIGIYDHERTTKQTIVLDFDMSFEIAKAAASEDINDALNYKTLTDTLREFVEASEFLLIETLAERIASMILNDFGVDKVKLTLHKPNALSASTDVGVIIERSAK